MEAPQINSPQKTSFWDFRHFKHYTSWGERILDFFSGFLFGYSAFYAFYGIYNLFSMQVKYIYLIYLGILIFILFKRKYMFWGMLLGLLLSTFGVFFGPG